MNAITPYDESHEDYDTQLFQYYRAMFDRSITRLLEIHAPWVGKQIVSRSHAGVIHKPGAHADDAEPVKRIRMTPDELRQFRVENTQYLTEQRIEKVHRRHLVLIAYIRNIKQSDPVTKAELLEVVPVSADTLNDDIKTLVKNGRIEGKIVSKTWKVWGKRV